MPKLNDEASESFLILPARHTHIVVTRSIVAKGDLLEWHHTPTMDGMLRGLIIKSRVKRTEDFLLVRPHSPALFRQGAAPGPQMLLQRQQQKIKSEGELKKAWEVQKKQEKEKTSTGTGPWLRTMQLPCRGCSDEASKGTELVEKHILYRLTVQWTVKTA